MPVEITEIFYPKVRQEWRDWVEAQLREDEEIWANFQSFALGYCLRSFGGRRKRLNWLIKNTRKGKMYGTVPIKE